MTGYGASAARRIVDLNTEVVRLHDRAQFEDALPLARKAASLARRHPGEHRLELASSLANMAGVLMELGTYAEARAGYHEALQIHHESPVLMVWQLAMTLNSMGALEEAVGDYPEAELRYVEALDLLRQHLDAGDADLAIPLNNLGRLYQAIGDYSSARRMLQESLDLRDGAGGVAPVLLARSLNNLAELDRVTGRYESAQPLYERALDLLRSADAHGDDLPATLNNLGALHRALGETERALPYYEEAVLMWSDRRGPDDLFTVSALSNLALVQERTDDLEQAEAGLRRALEVRRRWLGDQHPDVANSLFNLGLLRMRRGAGEEALDLLTQATAIEDVVLGQVTAMGSERQVMAHLATLRRTSDAYLSLVCLVLPLSPRAVRKALSLVLRRKAIGVEALTAQRTLAMAGDGPARQRVDQLRALRARIARTTLAGPGADGAFAERLTALQAERERLEAELARLVPQLDFALRLRSVDMEAVSGRLPEGATLVEFVRFDLLAEQTRKGRYLAFTLPAARRQVRMVDLGEAGRIDRLVRQFRSSVTGEDEGGAGTAGGAAPPGPAPGPALFEAVLAGLLRGLGRRLILAPDGELTRLPFAALPARGQRVLDLYDVSYAGSGRDLLRVASGAAAATAGLVLADPDFDLGSTTPRRRRRGPARRSRAWRRVSPFTPLRATRAEGVDVAQRLAVEPLLGERATEGRLKGSLAPRVLHLATHGFFFPDQARRAAAPDEDASRMAQLASGHVENPLLRAGLALAGANTWDRGLEPPTEAEDGILTAEDVAGLDLLGTELVVLSACDTGLGVVRFGDGVLGLRRAFAVAGARTLVMSLWKVPDRETRRLMTGFYRRLLAGVERWVALRDAQLELRRTHPDPFFWGAFVCEGDPGPLPPVVASGAPQ